jgi:integrase
VLIEHSNHISELAILLALWAIKVAKTINKRNKLNVVKTPYDYLSYIAIPLLKQVRNINFLSMDSNELANVYKKAILAKNVKHRSVLAGRMRLFHEYLQQNFNFEPVDWYEIEPTISRNEDAVDENIISMNEYNKMLSILTNDESFSAANRDINQLILILCYRAGLRTGEACYLKIVTTQPK